MIGCSLIVDLSTLSSDAAAPVDASDAALPGDAGDDGYFFDDFDREGGGPIGNGWIEKDPNSWAFTNGTVVRMPDGLNYQNAVVYRPSNEDIGDVAISVEFVANVAPPGFPQSARSRRSARPTRRASRARARRRDGADSDHPRRWQA